MNQLPDFSIRLGGAMPVIACIGYAQAAEIAGLAGIWFSETSFARGILPTATACAMTTVRLQINAGVFNPFTRHPTMMAMEIGALDEFSHERASLIVGTGLTSALEEILLRPDKPLAAVRDTIAIVRALLRGKEVDYAGPIFSARKVRLDYSPRANIPIFVAGRGNQSVKVASELADGLLLPDMCSLAFAGRVAIVLQTACRGGVRARLVQSMPCAVDDRRSVAITAAKRMVGEMLPDFWRLGQTPGSAKEGMLTGTDISEAEFTAASARLLAGENADRVLDERYVTAFALAGTPHECVVAAEKYAAAGVSELALNFGGANAAQGIQSIGIAVADRQRSDKSATAGPRTPRLL